MRAYTCTHKAPPAYLHEATDAAESGWYWTFTKAGINERSDTFTSEAEALADHVAVCSELSTAWHDRSKREAHLKEVVQIRAQRKELQGLAQSRTLAFARECLLPEPGSAAHVRSTAKARGFLNLGPGNPNHTRWGVGK